MAITQQSSIILIEELVDPKRKVLLVGPGLPYQGAAWGGQLRLKTTWYVGNNAEATQQVLGPTEVPSEWEGQWNTTRMVGEPSFYQESESSALVPIVRASSMRDVLEGIFQAGSRLRVTWCAGATSDARRISREGRAAEWKFAHARMDDIGWNITFEWIGRGRFGQRVLALRGEDPDSKLRDARMKLEDAISKAGNNTATANGKKRVMKEQASTFTLGDLEAFADGPMKMLQSFTRFGDAIVNRLKKIGDLVLKIRGMPYALANECLDTATNAINVSNQFCDAISNTPPETLAYDNKVSSLLNAASYYGATERDVESAIDAAVVLRDTTRPRTSSPSDGQGTRKKSAGSGDILAVWIAREGDTYASISTMFYQTPEHGYAIAKANAKTLPKLARGRAFAIAPPVGATLIIPDLVAVKNIEGG